MQRFSLYGVHKRDYQGSVTIGTDRRTHAHTDRRRTKWSLCAAMLRRRHFSLEFRQNFYICTCRKGEAFSVSMLVDVCSIYFSSIFFCSDLSSRPVCHQGSLLLVERMSENNKHFTVHCKPSFVRSVLILRFLYKVLWRFIFTRDPFMYLISCVKFYWHISGVLFSQDDPPCEYGKNKRLTNKIWFTVICN